MKRVVAAILLLATGAAGGVLAWEWFQARGGRVVYVLLRDREGLERGDAVRWRDLDIGRVADVDMGDDDRVRITLRLAPEYHDKLSRDSTFIVASRGLVDRERYLETHVLDPEAPPLLEGDTVEGVSSTLELTLRKAKRKAAELFDEQTRARWLDQANRQLDEMRREIAEIDWAEIERETEAKGEALVERLAELAEESAEEVERSVRNLEPKLEELVAELERMGKTEEARHLRERLRELAARNREAERRNERAEAHAATRPTE